MRELKDPRDIDAENFYRLVLIVRSIAIVRPQNLAKFAEQHSPKPVDESSIPIFEKDRLSTRSSDEPNRHLVLQLMDVLWSLHLAYPKNMALAPVVVPGLTHTEATIHAMVEIIHAFTTCDIETNTTLAAKLYLQLLLSSDTAVSFSAKQAIIRVLRPRYKKRKVYIPSPPICYTPSVPALEPLSSMPPRLPSLEPVSATPPRLPSLDPEDQLQFAVDAVEPIMLLEAGSSQAGAIARVHNPLEVRLGPPRAAPHILDIPPDADDETMVELAIALSLQDHESDVDLEALEESIQRGLESLQSRPEFPGLRPRRSGNFQGLRNLAAAPVPMMPYQRLDTASGPRQPNAGGPVSQS